MNDATRAKIAEICAAHKCEVSLPYPNAAMPDRIEVIYVDGVEINPNTLAIRVRDFGWLPKRSAKQLKRALNCALDIVEQFS